MQNITADAYLEPFPHLIFHNFYDDGELRLIWDELNFYTEPGLAESAMPAPPYSFLSPFLNL